ncbi:UNVERIFIED_ORG: hypothetical protein M2348_000708 [Sphingomonas sp. R1F5B]
MGGFTSAPTDDDGQLSLYFATAPQQYADLIVVAEAAIEWTKGLKAAAGVVDPEYEYRVTLVAAKPGSSNWIAKVERSKINKFAKRIEKGWSNTPLVMRVGIGLAVAVPTTIYPTYKTLFPDDGFTDKQKKELTEIVAKASASHAVTAHREKLYRDIARDNKIVGVGVGIPTSEDWRPAGLIPAGRFGEASGLFTSPVEPDGDERTSVSEIDVVLVTPRLENAKRPWVFRQVGLDGDIRAEMADSDFLAALERKDGIHEPLRANIPMRIRLEIKMKLVKGEWIVPKRGRRVTKVLYPAVG